MELGDDSLEASGLPPSPTTSPVYFRGDDDDDDSSTSTSSSSSSTSSNKENMLPAGQTRPGVFMDPYYFQQLKLFLSRQRGNVDLWQQISKKLLHLDWIADNPRDPGHAKYAATIMEGLEREFEIETGWKDLPAGAQRSRFCQWNKALFYGEWLSSPGVGENTHYIEVQIKRFSGADQSNLLARNGISDKVWVGLHNENITGVVPTFTTIFNNPHAMSGGPSRAGGPRNLPRETPFDAVRSAAAAAAGHRGNPNPFGVIGDRVTASRTAREAAHSPVFDQSTRSSSAPTMTSPAPGIGPSDQDRKGKGKATDPAQDNKAKGKAAEPTTEQSVEDTGIRAAVANSLQSVQYRSPLQLTPSGAIASGSNYHLAPPVPERGARPVVDESEHADAPGTATATLSRSSSELARELIQHDLVNLALQDSSSSDTTTSATNRDGRGEPSDATPRVQEGPHIFSDVQITGTAFTTAPTIPPPTASPARAARRSPGSETVASINARSNTCSDPSNAHDTDATISMDTSIASSEGSGDNGQDQAHYGVTEADEKTIRDLMRDAQRPDDELVSLTGTIRTDQLDRLFSRLRADAAFGARVADSYIYAVRIVAFPRAEGMPINRLSGPAVKDRRGTLLGAGGWVVPPLEERRRYVADHFRRMYRNKVVHNKAKYEGLPKPESNRCFPMSIDFGLGSGSSPKAVPFGHVVPVWRQLAEPTYEDVFWMAWQLLAGRRYSGFCPGAGLGDAGRAPDANLLQECPFTSPSPLAVFHTANMFGRE